MAKYIHWQENNTYKVQMDQVCSPLIHTIHQSNLANIKQKILHAIEFKLDFKIHQRYKMRLSKLEN